jgi:acetate kinase
MPGKAYMYAVPYEYYENDGIRRYGFHGTSHRYVSSRCAEMMGKPIEELKIISCHMGNGSSIAAVKYGKSVDTSMGFTPLSGLPMGTRGGDVDAGALQFIMNKYGFTIDEMLNIMNKKSGVLGISGVSSDFRDLDNASADGNKRASLALEMFQYWVAKVAGSYAAAMNGVDAIVFTAGVGENSAATRKAIAEYFGYLGVEIDDAANAKRGEDVMISTPDSKVKVFVIPTNEELVIARDTKEIVG